MSLSALLQQQRQDIERSRLALGGSGGGSHGHGKPVLFPRDYLSSRQGGAAGRASSALGTYSAPRLGDESAPRSRSAMGAAPVPKSHLNEALSLAISILKRYKREHMAISPEDAVLLAEVAGFKTDLTATAPGNTDNQAFAAAAPPTATPDTNNALPRSTVVSEQSSPKERTVSPGGTPADGAVAAAKRGRRSSRDLVNKLRGIVHNPQLYKDMVSMKSSVRSLTQFAVECSGKTGKLAELSHLIHEQIAGCVNGEDGGDAPKHTVDLLIVDAVGRDAATISLVDIARGTTMTVKPDDPLVQTTAGVHYTSAGEGCYPMAVDCELFAVARISGLTAEECLDDQQAQMMTAITGIAGLSLRTAMQFERLELQATKNAEMLDLVAGIASANNTQDVVVQTIMESAKKLVDCAHCAFHFVNKDGDLILGNPANRPLSSAAATSVVSADESTDDHLSLSGTIGNVKEGTINISGDGAQPDAASAAPATTGARTSMSVAMATRSVKEGGVIVVNDMSGAKTDADEIERLTGIRLRNLLILPVKDNEGNLIGVAQLSNKENRMVGGVSVPQRFSTMDETLFSTYASFAAISIANVRSQSALVKEKTKSEAILDVVKFLADSDIRDVGSVVNQTMQGAKKLLKADRSSLFLIDEERNELYSKVADDTGGKEIRFPIGRGIAGTVAKLGTSENIPDAYADPRFNKAFDIALGYVTKSMLTEAIFFQDEVIAVAQLVNKLEDDGTVGIFTRRDEETFRAFSLFAGISLRNSHLLNFAVDAGREAMELQELREGRRKVRQESVLVRNDISEAVVSHIMTQIDLADAGVVDVMSSRDFNLFEIREQMSNCYDVAVKLVFELAKTQGYLEEFKCPGDVFVRFVLACRDKYRNVPYHNFYHAVDVCQTVFTFIHEGRVTASITRLDEFVLLVTAVVHDLDHMGLNNSFHLKTDSPLGMLSSASGNNSVLEVHHCNLAIEILNDPAKDVFCGLDTDQKTHAYRRLIDCVLSTDMQRHNDVVNDFVAIDTFDVSNETHVSLACKMILKAADISNVTKPFHVSRKWGMSVTEEFYQQGDKEKEKGVAPLPMFDRSLNNELAKGQIGFIDFIAHPFFRKLSDRFVGLRWTVENIAANKAAWTNVLNERSGQK
uniref:Phosphodiesterase n=1 Tax=Neobodo designis TaxID=312471 RepID=A0A7S1Q107_NEODS|mmetsp:Transcript_2889/g.8991  ORF Transcript_2889/g.8991 Transcript_2889/m.8991 type:complete len:1135 (+) Transcript_2889:105-3509(+)